RALEELPGVAQACVFGVDDARWGQIVAAAIVPGAPPPDEAALAAHVAARLAPHKRPRRVALVEQLPVNASGKVSRRDAAARFAGALRPLGGAPAAPRR
ncbi:MAG TPA: hypothetical protein VFS00_06845, partial [Polyangiaceae bacterium]|nr:hypothetical protein [Polyangiaceae bacterium]